jgi:cob(I)alamin adenosyltransferase
MKKRKKERKRERIKYHPQKLINKLSFFLFVFIKYLFYNKLENENDNLIQISFL